jgi:hypothetical protein
MEDVELDVVVRLRANPNTMISPDAIGQVIGESINDLYKRRHVEAAVICEEVDIDGEAVWVR